MNHTYTAKRLMAEPYLEQLKDTVEKLGLQSSGNMALECKHFFSGAALFVNGKICASLTPAGLGIKLPAGVRKNLLEEGAGQELRYFEKAPIKREYVALSQVVINDPKRLKTLLVQSIGYVGK